MATATVFTKEMNEALGLVNDNFPSVTFPIKNPLSGIKNVVIYVRLSREDKNRVNPSLSPRRQRSTCEALAKHAKWKMLKVFDKDIGISGKSFAERPDWDAMMEFIKRRNVSGSKRERVDAVVVKDYTRFSRSTAEGLHVLDDELKLLSVKLRAADMPYVEPETELGRIYFIQMLMFAEQERLMIVKRTREGLEEKRRAGVHLGELPNFTKRDEHGRLVVEPIGLEILKMRSGGDSYDTIAKKFGIQKSAAWNLCRFIAKEVARIESEKDALLVDGSDDKADEGDTDERP